MSDTVFVRYYVETGKGASRGAAKYKFHVEFPSEFVPSVGDSVTLDDEVERTVVKRKWHAPDLMRAVNILLNDPTVTERTLER